MENADLSQYGLTGVTVLFLFWLVRYVLENQKGRDEKWQNSMTTIAKDFKDAIKDIRSDSRFNSEKRDEDLKILRDTSAILREKTENDLSEIKNNISSIKGYEVESTVVHAKISNDLNKIKRKIKVVEA